MQKHAARRLHYDFRLELGGVLLSWAVPKGPSLDPEVKRLAMQTEDHPVDYGEFEGVIPEGEYGGGTVLLWDRGTWQPEGDAEEMYRRGRLTFLLQGQKLRGKFHLVRTPGGARGERRWLLFKSHDEAARPGSDAQVVEAEPWSVASGRDLDSIAGDPDHVWTSAATEGTSPTRGQRRPRGGGGETAAPATADHAAARASAVDLPAFVEPQLATLSAEPPEGGDWLHEIKLDGYRILARVEGGHARLLSRRGHDWTTRLPSIASALGAVPADDSWLDGEVVVLRDDGVSDFQRLQNSMESGRDVACVYFVFDAPFLGGLDLRQRPLAERKELLRQTLAGVQSDRIRFNDHVRGGGPAFFARACSLGLEGIVSKRADAAYVSARGRGWLKVKCLARQELVIGGFTAPSGSRRHFGALLLGVREGERLVYAGKVGTGFTRESLAALHERLLPLGRRDPPFANPPSGAERRGVRWVEPRLVAEVAFAERTRDGMVRHASFQGLREDKAPEDVIEERAQADEARGGAQRRGRPASSSASGDSAAGRRRNASSGKSVSRSGAAAAKAPSPRQTEKEEAVQLAKAPSIGRRTTKKKAAAEPAKASSTARRTKKKAAAEPAKASSTARRTKKKAAAELAKASSTARRTTKKAAAEPAKASSTARRTTKKRETATASAGMARPDAARPHAGRAAGGGAPAASTSPGLELDTSRLEITNPDRVLFPEQGITKRELLLHYARAARWMLPQVVGRPLMLVRCPEGTGGQCFHQKHPSAGMPKAVQTVTVTQKRGPKPHLMIRDVEGLLGLVQMGALEIHAWGCRAERLDCPDQLVFDLDPDVGLPWQRVVDAALTLRSHLEAYGLTGFVRVTGGKGLHVVVPVEPVTPWPEAKAFTKLVADEMARAEPGKYLATMTKQKRRGKIFIDYFRNGFGATAVASYSTRARAGAPVAVPIGWDELVDGVAPDQYSVTNLEERLRTVSDSWVSFDDARAPLGTR